jgi:hypothetical protein
MNKKLLLSITILFLSFKSIADGRFKDYIITDNSVWALTKDGKIELFDKSGKPIEKRIVNSSEILVIAKDEQEKLVIADKQSNIKRYNDSNDSWEVMAKVKDNCHGIVFDSKNDCYLITDRGIKSLKSQEIYFSKESLNDQITYKEQWGKPYCYMMDKHDRIWLGFGYGEWGGNLFIFETTSKQFQTPKLDSFQINLWPIKSFFEDSNSVYLSAGLQHMFTSGIIVKFDNLNASIFFESSWKRNKKNIAEEEIYGEYIGPATTDASHKSIYFYSQNGIFKGEKTADLTTIKNWKVVLKPKLHWTAGQRDAVGSPMNVLKLDPLENGGLVFLAENDGIAFFDGKELKVLK